MDRLKQQVQQTSNQQYQIQMQKDELEQTVACKKQELDSNQDAMRQLIRSVFAQNEVAAAKEKEQLNDRLDRFAHNQQVMNQQIIELNDNITDTTSLNALYEAKRKELDLNYRNQETVLKEQIKRLSERIEYQENKCYPLIDPYIFKVDPEFFLFQIFTDSIKLFLFGFNRSIYGV